jgi:hypothetical protein
MQTSPLEPLRALATAIDELTALDPAVLAEGDTVLGLLAQLSRLEHVAAVQAVAFDDSPEWVDDGAQKSASWVTLKRRCPRRDARRRLRLGTNLRHMPHVADAWAAGAIDPAHVEVLVRARRPAVVELFARDEQLLVGFATSLSFCDFEKAIAYWCQCAAPDDAEAAAQHQRDQREVQLSQSYEGMWFGKTTLDPISGEIVANELRRLEQHLFDDDWKHAKETLGRTPTVDELARTAPQRRADALVEMATRSRTAPADGRRPAPLVTVLVGYETVHGRICELASGTVVTPGSLLPLLDQAYVERVVFDPAGRVLDVGRHQRLFTGPTRRAIEVRDRRCTDPLCDKPADQCEADHIIPFSQGGETTVENGRLRCGFHNRRRNHHPDNDQLQLEGTDDDGDDTDIDDDDASGAPVRTDPVSTDSPAEADEHDSADALVQTDPVLTTSPAEADDTGEASDTDETDALAETDPVSTDPPAQSDDTEPHRDDEVA